MEAQAECCTERIVQMMTVLYIKGEKKEHWIIVIGFCSKIITVY